MVHSCRSTLLLAERLTDQSGSGTRERPTGFHCRSCRPSRSGSRSGEQKETERNAKANYDRAVLAIRNRRSPTLIAVIASYRRVEECCSENRSIDSRAIRSRLSAHSSENPTRLIARSLGALYRSIINKHIFKRWSVIVSRISRLRFSFAWRGVSTASPPRLHRVSTASPPRLYRRLPCLGEAQKKFAERISRLAN